MAALKFYRKGPALLAGTLSILIMIPVAALPASLHQSLFETEQWKECYAECRRILQDNPNNHAVQLLALKSVTKLGSHPEKELKTLWSNPLVDRELKCEAASLLADILIAEGKPAEALEYLQDCFNNTQSAQLFSSSTRQANSIMNKYPALETAYPELINIIRTSAKTWKPRNKGNTGAISHLAKPALWIIAFYKYQINPAIGARCSLHPSCSAYAVEALKKHGAAGIALAGDRMVREPDVVDLKAKPVKVGNAVKYSDPLTDHDFWLQGDKQ